MTIALPAVRAAFPEAFTGGDPATLEDLADAIGSGPEKERLNRLLLEAARFEDEPPNDAHEALALLLREGMATVVCANWDTCIERAGNDIGAHLPAPTVLDSDRVPGAWRDGLHKVHGCASQPESLIVNSEDLGRPTEWVSLAVGADIGYQAIVFAGLGTVADYVGKRVTDVVKQLDDRLEQVHVVEREPNLSPSWAAILGIRTTDCHIHRDVVEFFCELLSALLSTLLVKVHLEAARLDEPQDVALQALGRLGDELRSQPPASAIRWWTDGTHPELRRHQELTKARAQRQLLGVAVLLGSDRPQAQTVDGVMTLELSDCYVELALANGDSGSDLKRRQSQRLSRREGRNAFPNRRKPVLVLHEGSTSPVDLSRTRDVLAANQPDNVIEGADQPRLRYHSLQAVLDERLSQSDVLAA